MENLLSYSTKFVKFANKIAFAINNSTSLLDYVDKGLLDTSNFRNKKATPGFSLTGKPYPKNYIGGFNTDGSGLPKGFDDDVTIDIGMDKDQIQFWAESYLGEVDPNLLTQISEYYSNFPLASQILKDKADYIKFNLKS